jgi:hypothetical protein
MEAELPANKRVAGRKRSASSPSGHVPARAPTATEDSVRDFKLPTSGASQQPIAAAAAPAAKVVSSAGWFLLWLTAPSGLCQALQGLSRCGWQGCKASTQ